MADFQYSNLSIAGHHGQPVPNLFLRQTTTTDSLAVIYPGLHYTCDMPVLYYPSMLLAGRSADVLQMKTDYTSSAFHSASPEEKMEWMSVDGLAGLRAGREQRDYKHLILIGKSIGTLVLASLISQDLPTNTQIIWLTPLLRRPELVKFAQRSSYASLYLLGSSDPNYDPTALKRIQGATGASIRVFDGANHSLEIPGQIHASLQIITELLESIGDFLDR